VFVGVVGAFLCKIKKRPRLEDFFEVVLILGLAMELTAVPIHIKEAAKSKERIVTLENANLKLRYELEKTITRE